MNQQQAGTGPSNLSPTSSSQLAQSRKQSSVTSSTNNPNLLSPSAANADAAPHHQQRKRSTLSANGFFIDYSCTRRRSSAAFQRGNGATAAAESVVGRSPFLRQVMGARRPSALAVRPESRQRRTSSAADSASSKPNSPARNSRPSCCASSAATGAGHAYLLPAGLGQAPAALSMVGSRKTSMFDPTGHSLAALAQCRRKSTLGPAAATATATMMAVARNAAAYQRASSGRPMASRAKSELVQRVPVIGCSPTSIKASLAALEETRRYEKLLRKLRRHQRHKDKRRKQLSEAVHSDKERDSDADPDDGDDDDDDVDIGVAKGGNDNELAPGSGALSLRRKSLRALRDAGALVNRTTTGQLHQWHWSRHRHRRHRRTKSQDPFVDGLSISSTLSFASSQTSLPSIDRFLDECERAMFQDDEDEDEDYDEGEEDDDDDDLDLDDNNLDKWALSGGANAARDLLRGPAGPEQETEGKRSFVGKAMRKLASSIVPSRVINSSSSQPHVQQRQSLATIVVSDETGGGGGAASETSSPRRRGQQAGAGLGRRRSVSMSTGLNYWHYYYYLRGNSFDAIDDLPLGAPGLGCGAAGSAGATGVGASEGPLSESERRTRLYVNFSLARLDILNSNTDPATRLADKLASRARRLDLQQQQQLAGGHAIESPVWNQFFDFSQSSDVSLSLSTVSTELDSSDTSRNSSSLSSPVADSSSSTSNGGGLPAGRQLEPRSPSRCSVRSSAGRAAIAGPSDPSGFISIRAASPLQANSLPAALSTMSPQSVHSEARDLRTLTASAREPGPANNAAARVLSDGQHRQHLADGPADHLAQPGQRRASGLRSGQRELPATPAIGEPQPATWADELRCNELAAGVADDVASHQYKSASAAPRQRLFGQAAAAAIANEEELGPRDEEDDFERFNRFYKPTKRLELERRQDEAAAAAAAAAATAAGSPSPAGPQVEPNQPGSRRADALLARDSHFRLSVKSLRSSGDNRGAAHTNGSARNNGTPTGGGSIKTRRARAREFDFEHEAAKLTRSAGGAGGSLRARAFLSWDALTCEPSGAERRWLSRSDFRDSAARPLAAQATTTGQPCAPADYNYGRRSFRHYPSGGGGGGAATVRRTLPQVPTASACPTPLSSSTTLTATRTISGGPTQPASESRRPGQRNQAGGADNDDRRAEDRSAAGAEALQQQFEAQMTEAANLAATAAASSSRRPAASHFVAPSSSRSSMMLSDYCDARNQNNRPAMAPQDPHGPDGSPRELRAEQSRRPSNNNSASSSDSSSSARAPLAPGEARANMDRATLGASQQAFDARQQSNQQRQQPQWQPSGQSNANTITGPNAHESLLAPAPARLRARSHTNVVNLDIDGSERAHGGQGGAPSAAAALCLSSSDVNRPSEFVRGRGAGSDQDDNGAGLGGPNWPAPLSSSSWLSLHTSAPQPHQLRRPRFSPEPGQMWQLSRTPSAEPTPNPAPPANGRRVTSGSFRVPKWRERELQQRRQQEVVGAPLRAGNNDYELGAAAPSGDGLGPPLHRPTQGLQQQQRQQQSPHHRRLDGDIIPMEADRRAWQQRLAPDPAGPLRRADADLGLTTAIDDSERPRARAHSTGSSTRAAGLQGAIAIKELAHQVARDARLEPTSGASPTFGDQGASTSNRFSANIQSSSYKSHNDNELTTGHKQAATGTSRPESTAQRATAGEQLELDESIKRDQSELIENQRALFLLRKNSFTCMLVGARQTGKRTIVKCFIKLLNEFKLAAEEYKKEKMLSKLVECTERIQELAEEQQQQQQQQAAEQRCGRSRLNSWLGGGGYKTVNKLLNLSPKSKRRLHSVAGLWAPKEGGGGGGDGDQNANNLARQQQALRRHTTIVDQPPFQQQTPASTSRWLKVDRSQSGSVSARPSLTAPLAGNLLTCNNGNNKSDSNVHYSAGKERESPECEQPGNDPTVTTHQLQVPAFGSYAQLRKHSDPTNGLARKREANKENEQRHRVGSLLPNANGRQATRRHTSATFNLGDQQMDEQQQQQQQRRKQSMKLRQRVRRQSVFLNRRSKKILLSLKELNRRRCGIKFKTRRQISETCLEQLRQSVIEDTRRRASVFNRSALMQADMVVDSFIVVYSINDRESFEYAKTLVGQLRAHKQDVPMPIVLVANKVDLERARVVKREEGRLVARRNACKFMEISCTIGFNLDNLLVGLRTQLILRHHIILNSILLGKFPKNCLPKQHCERNPKPSGTAHGQQQPGPGQTKAKASQNILVRFYKRYVIDNSKQEYDCDNFSKL